MLTQSLLQCRACRLTWFPQAGTAAGCPACGGTDIGGTLELFHAGIALILFGLIGWFLRHGPLSEGPATAVAALGPTKPATASVDRGSQVSAPARKNQVYVSSKKIKSSKVKRRPKKAKTRSKHVQR